MKTTKNRFLKFTTVLFLVLIIMMQSISLAESRIKINEGAYYISQASDNISNDNDMEYFSSISSLEFVEKDLQQDNNELPISSIIILVIMTFAITIISSHIIKKYLIDG